jgi:hypothetical protein
MERRLTVGDIQERSGPVGSRASAIDAWLIEASDKANFDRVANCRKDNRDG